jgi:hypothetical protein
MNEAAGGTPEELARQELIQKSVEDEELRRRLLSDPKGTVEQELGTVLPESIDIRAVEETPETIYLVLPPSSSEPGGELSERDLEAVAGGWGGGGYSTDGFTCNTQGPETAC